MHSCLFMLLLNSVLPAAPVPKDFPTPPARVKLVGTVRGEAKITGLMWLPDGKHLFAVVENKELLVWTREQFAAKSPTAKPFANVPFPSEMDCKLQDTGTWVFGVTPAKGFITETELHLWSTKAILEGKPKDKPNRSVVIDIPKNDGLALSDDGKTLIMLDNVFIPNKVNPQFGGSRVPTIIGWDTNTGAQVGEPLMLDGKKITALNHPLRANAHTLLNNNADGLSVQRLDTSNGKVLADVALTTTANSHPNSQLIESTNGEWLCCVFGVQPDPRQNNLPRGGAPGGGGMGAGFPGAGRMQPVIHSLCLIDIKTGKAYTHLLESQSARPIAVSNNGTRLAMLELRESRVYLNIVEPKANRLLKTWPVGTGNTNSINETITLSFSPTSQELAVVDLNRTGTIALWDVTGPKE